MSVNWLIFMTKKMNQFKGNRYKKETAFVCLLLVSEWLCAESAMRVGKGSYAWAWSDLLSVERERERQLYGGAGSRRAYWKQQAHQISRNIELKWLTTFYDCVWELPNRVEFSGQSRVVKLHCEFSWGDANKCLFVPGGAWVTEQRRSCSCFGVVNQWVYWACCWECVWHKDSLMDEEVHLTISDDSWKLYPCNSHHNCLMIIYIKYVNLVSEAPWTLKVSFTSKDFWASLSFLSGHVSIERKLLHNTSL